MANEHYPGLAGAAQIHQLEDVLDYESGKGWKLKVRLMSPFHLSARETLIILHDEKNGSLYIRGNEDRLHIGHPGQHPFGEVTSIEMIRPFFPMEGRDPEMNVYYLSGE